MIHQIVPSLHKELGGVDVSVRELCFALQAAGTPVLVHALTAPELCDLQGLRISNRFPGTPARLGFSPAMWRELCASVQSGDLVHNHSLWMAPNVYAGWIAAKRDCPLVISPHGTLTGWARSRSRYRKLIMGWLGQNKALAIARCFHVTADSEMRQLREMGIRQPVALIPHGVGMAEVATPRNSQPKSDGMRVLFLSRLHPAKGLELLLRVWARIEATHPAAALEVVGPDEGGHGTEMEKLARDLRLRSVRFLGPLVGDAKQQAFARADLYVLPTHSENFGLTVAEALAAGTPVICTKGAPWSGLETHRCGWWIDRTEESLFRAIDAAHRLPAHVLTEMGARGREWVIREFSWTEVARRMNALYAWLLGNGGRPECVHEE